MSCPASKDRCIDTHCQDIVTAHVVAISEYLTKHSLEEFTCLIARTTPPQTIIRLTHSLFDEASR